MNTITAITSKLTEAGYAVNGFDNARGERNIATSNGGHVVYVRPNDDGTVTVSEMLDYGDYGQTFCDSGTYKSAAGAVRRAVRFLGKAA